MPEPSSYQISYGLFGNGYFLPIARAIYRSFDPAFTLNRVRGDVEYGNASQVVTRLMRLGMVERLETETPQFQRLETPLWEVIDTCNAALSPSDETHVKRNPLDPAFDATWFAWMNEGIGQRLVGSRSRLRALFAAYQWPQEEFCSRDPNMQWLSEVGLLTENQPRFHSVYFSETCRWQITRHRLWEIVPTIWDVLHDIQRPTPSDSMAALVPRDPLIWAVPS